jgi:hypothetical protein
VTVLRFTVPGQPVSTNQGYRTVTGRGGRPILKLSDEAGFYKAMLVNAARKAHRLAGSPPAIQEDAIVAVRFFFPTLGSDLDGPGKFVLDSVASGSRGHPGARLVVNDTRVRQLIIEKADPDGQPRTVVAVASADEDGCPHCGCLCSSLLP